MWKKKQIVRKKEKRSQGPVKYNPVSMRDQENGGKGCLWELEGVLGDRF